jgi:hypothetical protein
MLTSDEPQSLIARPFSPLRGYLRTKNGSNSNSSGFDVVFGEHHPEFWDDVVPGSRSYSV